MLKFVFFTLGILLMGACTTTPTVPTVRPTQDDTAVQLLTNNLVVEVQRPVNWRYYPSSDRIVLSEQMQPVQADGALAGFVANIFFHTPDGDRFPMTEETPTALRAFLRAHAPQHARQVTTPVSFQWHGYDAAMYTVQDEHDTRSAVIALAVWQAMPELEAPRLLMINLSAPDAEFERLDAVLADLLNEFTINEDPLNPVMLTSYLGEPRSVGNASTAMEASPPAR